MFILLTLVLSFYPTIFIYQSIPSDWMSKIDTWAPANTSMFFFVHLALFLLIFFVIHMVFRKYLSLGYYGRSTGIFAIVLMCALLILVSLITFYTVLPGDIVYHLPDLVAHYVLKNPYQIIILFAPWAYLFFE